MPAGRPGTWRRREPRLPALPRSLVHDEGADRDRSTGSATGALGAFIREQRKAAHLSLRQLAELTRLSHAYLSQIERGLHQPSVRVLRAISEALNLSARALLAEAGLFDAIAGSGQDRKPARPDPAVSAAEQAIRRDERLSADQKAALIAVYRSMLGVLFNVRVIQRNLL